MSNAMHQVQRDALLEPSYVFSTAGFEKSEQFAAFAREFSELGHYRLPDSRDAAAGFSARVRGYRLQTLRVAIFETDAYIFAAGANRAMLYGEDWWVLTARLQGRAEVIVDGERQEFAGSRLEVSAGHHPRPGTVSDNQTMLVYLPRRQFAGIVELIDKIAASPSGGITNPLMTHYLAAMARVLPHLPRHEVGAMAEATIAAIRSCLSYTPRPLASGPPLMADRFELARKHIAEQLTSPGLTPASVCAALGISRRQLYYMFEKVGGFYRYVRGQRLVACSRALVRMTPGDTIASLAAEFGFTDAARFSTAFRAQFGCSPRHYRAAAMAADEPSTYLSFLEL